ncbi:MAG: DotA/TraY family protein [Candidatus Competibacteraceae bacterium]|jgi:conjugal transfer/type IV secretion protein DotA/TraY|nr:DotA/TraY family protein [Candidatus Competibacteraceae bacterium]
MLRVTLHRFVRLLILALLLATGVVQAQGEFSPEQLEPTEGDLSVSLLRNIFGPVIDKIRFADSLSGSDTGAFGEMFGLFNGFLLLMLVLFLFVKGVASLMDTAHEGEALGQERSTVWTPLRIFLSVAMLIPLVNGYCLIQVGVLWVTLSGAGLADAIWDKAVDKFQTVTLYQQPPPPEARQLAIAMLASNLCELVLTDIPARGDAKYVVKYESNPGERGVVSERTTRFSVPGLGKAACGGFVIREPGKDIMLERGITGIDAFDRFNYWLGGLLGFGTETRRMFGVSMMNAHEISALNMRKALRPLAERLFEGKGDLQECVPVNTGSLSGGQCLSAIDAAAENYVAELKGLIAGVINEAGQRAFGEFSATAKGEGWLTAGSWFYRLAALTEYMNKLALNVPEPYPIRIFGKLPREDIETYGHLFLRLDAVVMEAETDSGLGLTRGGDPNNSQLDDVSRGLLRLVIDWIAQGMFTNTHPLFAISWIGHAMIAIVLTSLGIIGVSKTVFAKTGLGRLNKALGGVTGMVTNHSTESLNMVGMVLGVIVLALLSFALIAAIFLPMAPFIIWTLASLHWVILVFEALLAAPIWAVWHIRNGKGFTAETMNGWLLMFSLLLRPALMLFGLLGATIISFYLLSLVSGTFVNAAVNAASGNATGPVMVIGLLILFILVAVDLTLRCFSLIHRLPDFALRWVGGSLETALEHHDLQRRMESAMRGGVDTALRALGRTRSGKPKESDSGGAPKVKPMDGGKDP